MQIKFRDIVNHSYFYDFEPSLSFEDVVAKLPDKPKISLPDRDFQIAQYENLEITFVENALFTVRIDCRNVSGNAYCSFLEAELTFPIEATTLKRFLENSQIKYREDLLVIDKKEGYRIVIEPVLEILVHKGFVTYIYVQYDSGYLIT